ncbi:MAG: rRNA adenine N-6-methyltransferase family protein [Nanoarchaeota archaeon]|nr:rRNA adenine N-6-methyltransferase family protein [Nanoarchaeota archaeon]
MQYDQHYLIDETIVTAMIQALDITKNDVILEIGPGTGAITKTLAETNHKIIAIEKDKELAPHLSTLPNNVLVIYGDALEHIHHFAYTKIISNVPFSLVEPLFRVLHKQTFDKAVLLVGEQFYNNMQHEGLWYSIINNFYELKQTIPVPATSFNPQPRTAGIILVLTKKEGTGLIREFLLQDDKKVKNALLYSYVHEGKTKKEAKTIIAGLGLPELLLEKPSHMISNKEFLLIKQHLENTSSDDFVEKV